MKKIENKKKNSFLNSIPTASIEPDKDTLTPRCKFNFSYMDFNQPAGQKIEKWTNTQLHKLFNKLHKYCKKPLKYWEKQSIGKKKGHILKVYGNFPKHSDFVHPKHVPHQVLWGRFRMEYSVRLVGFIVPYEYGNTKNEKTGYYFDCNTFYVVFLL